MIGDKSTNLQMISIFLIISSYIVAKTSWENRARRNKVRQKKKEGLTPVSQTDGIEVEMKLKYNPTKKIVLSFQSSEVGSTRKTNRTALTVALRHIKECKEKQLQFKVTK